MIDVFKYEKKPNYPHMSEADKAIWERFIDKYPAAYLSCQYDFHIGDPPPFNTLYDNDEDFNQDKLYRKRIDVLGETKEFIDVIEIKPKAGLQALGQVRGYRTLYIRDFAPTKKVRAVLITDIIQPDMEYMAKEEDVVYIVV